MLVFPSALAVCLHTVVDSVLRAGLGPGSEVVDQNRGSGSSRLTGQAFCRRPLDLGSFSVFLMVGLGYEVHGGGGIVSNVGLSGFPVGSGRKEVKDLGLSNWETRPAVGWGGKAVAGQV